MSEHPVFRQPTHTVSQEEIQLLVHEYEEQKKIDEATELERKSQIVKRRGKAEADKEEAALRRVVTRPASSYTPRRPRWLWAPGSEGHGRIPLGKLTLLVGRGGVGKTTLECQFSAWITTGEMEGDFFGYPKDVLWVVYEDDIEDTILPRLISAGADLDRVHFLTLEQLGAEERVLLPTDCDEIERVIREKDAAVLMVDPLSGALRVDNSNDAKKMRAAVEAVQAMCLRAYISCIGVAHTRKALSNNLMDAILGSSEMGNVARAAIGLMADLDQPGTVVLSQEKNNGAPMDIHGYRYSIVENILYHNGEMIRSSRLEFLGKVEPQAVTAMLEDQAAGGNQGRGARDEAKQFIIHYLRKAGGAAPRAEIIDAANKERLSCSRATLDRAAKALGVVGDVPGTSRMWTMP